MISASFILLTNDDGVAAPGLSALEAKLSRSSIPHAVSAPLHERSGCGHSITLNDPLRVRSHGENRFAVSGTPTDAVTLYFDVPLGPRPDLVISGINLGANLARDLTYSGTVCAAVEGVYHGVTAVAVSLFLGGFFDVTERQFERAASLLVEGVIPFIERPFEGRSLYETPRLFNVNIPLAALEKESPEIRWTSLGRRNYGGQIEQRTDPRGRPYYWIGGDQHGFADIPGSDCNAVREGAVSVTPLSLAFTDEETLTFVRSIR